MNAFDVIIVMLLTLLAVIGYAQGFVVGAASLVGLGLGGVVGTRLSQFLLEQATSNATVSAWGPVFGLVAGLLITIMGAMAMQDLGAEIRARMHSADSAVILDHMLGAVLLFIVGVLLVWFASAMFMGMPQLRSQRERILDSRILGSVNQLLPPAGPVVGAISSYDPFPQFSGGAIDTPPPDGRLPTDPQVRAATRSVVRIEGEACGYKVTGSGWVAANEYVVTNAHVVAGQERTEVELRGGSALEAEIVTFDERNDLAILRVEGLSLPVLPTRGLIPADTAGVVVGFPEQRGLTSTAARFSDQRQVRGRDIYNRGPFVRSVTSFRGIVRHGNSGGPVVDGDGRVITTVFASTVGEKVQGGYGVPNQLVGTALQEARSVPKGYRMRTGGCVS